MCLEWIPYELLAALFEQYVRHDLTYLTFEDFVFSLLEPVISL